ncbi:hypothetical protein MJH12_12320 [bacterium]|nr:hypothetical protein [bacterium]
MTSVIEVFNDSWDRVQALDDRFISIFHESFFASSPEIPVFFKETNLDNQKKLLRTTLLYIMSYSASRLPLSSLKRLSNIHNKLKVKVIHFDLWMDAVINTIKIIDPKFNENIAKAWRETFQPGLEFMKKSLNHH